MVAAEAVTAAAGGIHPPAAADVPAGLSDGARTAIEAERGRHRIAAGVREVKAETDRTARANGAVPRTGGIACRDGRSALIDRCVPRPVDALRRIRERPDEAPARNRGGAAVRNRDVDGGAVLPLTLFHVAYGAPQRAA